MTLKRQIAIGWAATLFLGIIGVAGLDGRAQVPSRPMPPTTGRRRPVGPVNRR